MSKNLFDLRFAIRRDDGFISSIWRLWITSPGDVYLRTGKVGGIEKYSFHKTGICRSAFTSEYIEKYGTPASIPDRAMFEWNRSATPEVNSGKASRVAWIAFPTDYLSRNNQQPQKTITWIDAAPSGRATFIELSYTAETEEFVVNAYKTQNERRLISYTQLPTNEAFVASYYHGEWENKDVRSQAKGASGFHNIFFSADDPRDTGRPVRIRFGPKPKHGDALVLQELGGYEETPI